MLTTVPNTKARMLFAFLFIVSLVFAVPHASKSAPESKRIVVLDVDVGNDIGVENAASIATQWVIDSVSRVAPNAEIIPGDRAARLSRLDLSSRMEDITPSAAMTLKKSIDSTHVLDCRIFLWEKKYGVTLRLMNLSDAPQMQIERGWANTVGEIPQKIEELTGLLFSPPKKRETAKSVSPESVQVSKARDGGIPVEARALLQKHPEMVYVPAGEFLMGNDNDSDADNIPVDPSRREGLSRFVLLAAEKPEHTVRSGAFLIDKYEVTNAEFKKFRPSHEFPPEKADYPVTGISWYDAKAYAEWAGKRLPTEAEWEKAARGSDGRKWPWGNIFERNRCNLGSDVAPVGSFAGDKSPYGAFDMAGNVQEWTASRFIAYPDNLSDSVAFDKNKMVVRGSYYGGNDFLARGSMRFCAFPGEPGKKPEGTNYAYIGFRCVMDID